MSSVTWTATHDWKSVLSVDGLRQALGRDDEEVAPGDLADAFDLHLAAREVPPDPESAMREMTARFARASGRPKGVLCGIQQSMTMAGLAGLLEGSLQRPVLDETGLTESYDFDVAADKVESAEALLDLLAKHTGLVFTPARRMAPRLAVRPR